MSFEHVIWTEESPDGLRRVTWNFWLYDLRLVLDRYCVEVRPTKRHGFKAEATHERLPSGRGSYAESHLGRVLTESEVPLTEEIRARAIHEFTAKLKRVPQRGEEVWDVYVLREPGCAWERFYGFRLTEAEARDDVLVARETLRFEFPQVIAEARKVG